MTEADIAISAGGTTLLELCACGTPMLIYTCADNQIEGAKALAGKICAPWIGDARGNPDIARDIFKGVNLLRAHGEMRAKISRAGRLLIDGCGAERIVKSIFEAMNEQN